MTETDFGSLQDKRIEALRLLAIARNAVKKIEKEIAELVCPFRVGQLFIYVAKAGDRHSGVITRIEYKPVPPFFMLYGSLARKNGYRLARRIYRPDLLITNDVAGPESEEVIAKRIEHLKRQRVINPHS